MSKLIPIACLALPGTAGYAAADKKAAAQGDKVRQVNVSGTRADTEMRRLSTASTMIVGREEFDRNGDTSIGELLERLPGVTIGGPPINIVLREGDQQKDTLLRMADGIDQGRHGVIHDVGGGVKDTLTVQPFLVASRNRNGGASLAADSHPYDSRHPL
jgi:hypothetical protein